MGYGVDVGVWGLGGFGGSEGGEIGGSFHFQKTAGYEDFFGGPVYVHCLHILYMKVLLVTWNQNVLRILSIKHKKLTATEKPQTFYLN